MFFHQNFNFSSTRNSKNLNFVLGGLTVGPPIAKPVGGHILAHLSTYIFLFFLEFSTVNRDFLLFFRQMLFKKHVFSLNFQNLGTTRVQLRKGRGEQRIAKIVDSPTMPENDAVLIYDLHYFQISSNLSKICTFIM